MTTLRTVMVAVLLFVGGFSLALESWLGHKTTDEIETLRGDLEHALAARDGARDRYDAVVYEVLFSISSDDAIEAPWEVSDPESPIVSVVFASLGEGGAEQGEGMSFHHRGEGRLGGATE